MVVAKELTMYSRELPWVCSGSWCLGENFYWGLRWEAKWVSGIVVWVAQVYMISPSYIISVRIRTIPRYLCLKSMNTNSLPKIALLKGGKYINVMSHMRHALTCPIANYCTKEIQLFNLFSRVLEILTSLLVVVVWPWL